VDDLSSPPPSPPPPGLGPNLRPGRGIRDTRLAERALRERWPIPTSLRKPLVARLAEIIEDTDSSPREVTAAARALLEASRCNLQSIETTIRATEHGELADRMAELEAKVGGGKSASRPGWTS
jgi:hypothetical protein